MDHDAFFGLFGGEGADEQGHADVFEPVMHFDDNLDGFDQATVDVDHAHVHAAIAAAVARAHYDPSQDDLTPAFVNDIQGITAEYLVAEGLNDTHDGLQYRLFSDPTHPDVDIAGLDSLGNVVRLIQVKATGSAWYAESALQPGLEVITSSDSWRDGLLKYDMTSAELRAIIEAQLQ